MFSRSLVIKEDIIYRIYQGVPLTMDLYYPRFKEDRLPVIIYVHGGGWYSGNKNTGVGLDDIPGLVKRGYLVVTLNYRHAPQYKFPSQIEDLKCAVSFLRSKSDVLGLDPLRIGVYGDSAGGHLAALLGLTDDNSSMGIACQDQSSRVQAVVNMFGPSDLTWMNVNNRDIFIEHVFGNSAFETEILSQASPVAYVSSATTPFLLIHGENDTEISPEHSRTLYQKLVSAGVPASLVMVENAGHNFVPVGGPINPSRAQITNIIGDFFDQHLK